MKLFTHARSLTSTFIAFSLVLVMQACGGGGGGAAPNAAPVFTSGAAISAAENNTATGYTAVATDAENSTVTFRLSGGADQLKFSIDASTGVLTFLSATNFESPTDIDTNNSYVVDITAADGTNEVVKTVTVTVTLAAPVLSTSSARTYAQNAAITTLSFNNTAGASLTSCTSGTLPTGLSIAISSDNSTCEITGTPTALQSSTTYTVTATNATGSDTATVSIAVKDASGYYTGSAAVKQEGNNLLDFNVTDLQIMINGNRIMMMSDAQALLYDGTFTLTGNTLTSTVTIYHNGNKMAATAALTATVSVESQITGTLTGTELGNGTFVSTFSNLSNTVSALSQVNSNFWITDLNEATNNSFEFELKATSALLESTSPNNSTFQNCRILAGNGSTYAPIVNSSLFAVTIVFSSCTTPDVDGTYTGFSQALTSTSIAATVSNGTYAFADDFIRN